MPVYKDNKTNTWRAVFRYTDWTGEKKQTQKRGFITQRAAKAWEKEEMLKLQGACNMTFDSFVELYFESLGTKLKLNTINTKRHIFETKILPLNTTDLKKMLQKKQEQWAKKKATERCLFGQRMNICGSPKQKWKNQCIIMLLNYYIGAAFVKVNC